MQVRSDNRPETTEAVNAFAGVEAYVKPIEYEGRTVYAIHGPDGQQLAVAETRDLAFAFIRQQELTGADVH